MTSKPLLSIVPVLVLVAGCLDATPAALPVPGGHAHDHDQMLPSLEARNCVQAGGNSLYEMQEGRTKVGPFYAADQRAEVGNPMIGAYGRPVMGPQNGIWHTAVICTDYTYDGKPGKTFHMGWIAQMIKKPDYDTSDARLHFFVADLSFNQLDFVKTLREQTSNAEISPNTQTVIDLLPGQKYMRVVIQETNHGTFDFTAELHKEYGVKQTEHIRFWMLVATDGSGHVHGESEAPGKYRPIAIDVFDTVEGTPRPRLAGESAGTFMHIQDVGKPGENHFGNPLGHYQSGFARTIKLAPAPEGVYYNETWLH